MSRGGWRVSAKQETFTKTVGIVVAVCLACSIVVSSAAVGLRQQQKVNEELDKQANILEAAGLLETAQGNIAETYSQFVEQRFVELATGEYVEMEAGYDMYKAARDPDTSSKVNTAGVGFLRRANVASVYLVKDEAGQVSRIILPVHGSGLWDLMYGFMALDSDGNTIREMIYYKHKETPGLGGEVVNPAWKALWDGKQLFDNGRVAIEVKKNAGDSVYAVDGLSGATLTGNGVQKTIQYWVGAEGFGPFLAKKPWNV
jgi:Na+-transporting NADH:ubiquinone oxidoreductase subunit C